MDPTPLSPRKGMRVQLFFGESDRVGSQPRYVAVLAYLRREGAAGATVTRGVAGFGLNSVIHTSTVLRLSEDLPMIVTWIDAPERVHRLLPGLLRLAGSGVVTVEDVGIASYAIRPLEQLRFDLKVEEVMTREPVSSHPEASVHDLIERLLGQRFRSLPVIDDQGVLLGVVTNTDLVERAGLPARIELLHAMAPSQRSILLKRVPPHTVRECMTAEPVTVAVGETLRTATFRMADHNLKRLPVVDARHRLVGMLSRSDVLAAVSEYFPRSQPDEILAERATTVAEIIRRDVPSVAPEADLATLLDVIVSTRLNRALVVDADGEVVGVVNDADVMRALGTSEKVLDRLMRRAGMRSTSSALTARHVARPAEVLPETAPLAEAARIMVTHQRKVLVVVDSNGKLLGMLDRADILRACRDTLADLSEA